MPPVFQFIEEQGGVDHEEMYRVFNMGIGYTIIVRKRDAEQAMAILRGVRARPTVIGRCVKGSGTMQFAS